MESQEQNDRILSLKETLSYTKGTIDYLKINGLRSDPVKDALEAETCEKFPSDLVMVTNRQECELFESILQFANARNCIEIGVFTGSSAMSLARGVGPTGKVVALDISEEFTNLAKKHWEIAGVSDRIELILGPAAATLNKLISEGKEGTFDFVYIDADKPSYPEYYELALKLLRSGGIIAIDNVIWGNAVADLSINDLSTTTLRELNRFVINDLRVKNVILPIADGVNLVRKV